MFLRILYINNIVTGNKDVAGLMSVTELGHPVHYMYLYCVVVVLHDILHQQTAPPPPPPPTPDIIYVRTQQFAASHPTCACPEHSAAVME